MKRQPYYMMTFKVRSRNLFLKPIEVTEFKAEIFEWRRKHTKTIAVLVKDIFNNLVSHIDKEFVESLDFNIIRQSIPKFKFVTKTKITIFERVVVLLENSEFDPIAVIQV